MRPPFKVEIWKPVDDNPHLFAVTESFEAGEKPIRRLSLTFEWAKSSECAMLSEHCCFLQMRMTSLWIKDRVGNAIPSSRETNQVST